MAQIDRLYKLKSLFDSGRCIDKAALLAELEVSPATLKRDLTLLRDRMNQPVAWDRERRGYFLDHNEHRIGTQFELPGLWLNAEEIHALLTMQQLLTRLDAGGLLAPHIGPLQQRLARMLGSGAPADAEVARRIRVQTVASRQVPMPHFQAVGTALLRRQRLLIRYLGRSSQQTSEREVSPQRLIHCRDNWTLVAWCHLRHALRSFSVAAIQQVQVLGRKAIDVPDEDLDTLLGAGHGIAAAGEVPWATLRFSPERAGWVAAETWHPAQRGRFEDDGSYVLELPYTDERALVMDVLRHVPQVEVLQPQALREAVREDLLAGLRRYAT